MAVAFEQTLRAAGPVPSRTHIALVAVPALLFLWLLWLLTPSLPVEQSALAILSVEDQPGAEMSAPGQPRTRQYLALFPGWAQRRMHPGAGGVVVLADGDGRQRWVAARLLEVYGDGLRVHLQTSGASDAMDAATPAGAMMQIGRESPLHRWLAGSGHSPDTVVLETADGRYQEIAVKPAHADGHRPAAALPAAIQGQGTLFINPQPQETTLWTRGSPTALDILFIGPDGRIMQMLTAAADSTALIRSRGPVLATLELGAGEAARSRIAPGDRVFSSLLPPGPTRAASP